jgi:hypothetical protein
MDITAIELRAYPDGAYGANLIPTAASWKADEVALLKYLPAAPTPATPDNSGAEDAAASADSSAGDAAASDGSDVSPLADAQVRSLYEARITFADGTVSYLHNINFTSLEEPALAFSDGLAYLKYKENGKNVETLELEKAAKVADEARAEAEAKAAEDARAAEEAAAEAAAQPAAGGYSYDYSASTGSAAAPSEQSTDVCLDDVVVTN